MLPANESGLTSIEGRTETDGRKVIIRWSARFRYHGFSITKGSSCNPERRETSAKTSFEPGCGGGTKLGRRGTFSIKVVITKDDALYA